MIARHVPRSEWLKIQAMELDYQRLKEENDALRRERDEAIDKAYLQGIRDGVSARESAEAAATLRADLTERRFDEVADLVAETSQKVVDLTRRAEKAEALLAHVWAEWVLPDQLEQAKAETQTWYAALSEGDKSNDK